jgi:hypothetical protein
VQSCVSISLFVNFYSVFYIESSEKVFINSSVTSFEEIMSNVVIY